MRISILFLASAALLATACNAEKGTATSSEAEVAAKPVPAPNNGDWSTVVTKTAEGGFVMTGETDTRYLIVTHNAVTMARMHRLYGVTMIERGVSRLVSVDLGGAEELLAAE